MVRRYGWLGGMGEEGKETVRNGKEQKKKKTRNRNSSGTKLDVCITWLRRPLLGGACAWYLLLSQSTHRLKV